MKKLHVSLQSRKALTGYSFVLPWILGIGFFFFKPLVESLCYSFSEVKMSPEGITTKFVGLENYKFALLRDPLFNQQLLKSLGDTLQAIVIIVMFSLLVSVLLNSKFRGRNFYRAVFFMPVIMTTGVVYLLIQLCMNGNETKFSSINSTQNSYMFQSNGIGEILLRGGLPTDFVQFITDLVNNIFNMVSKSGVQILLFLSGLQKIPQSHYEDCRIEGAKSRDAFWKITFPVISPIIFLNIIYTAIDSFISYGNEKHGNIVMYAIQQWGFAKSQRLDYASAMSWIYFTVVIIILLLFYLIIGRRANKVMDSEDGHG